MSIFVQPLRLGLIAATVAALGLTACGGGDDEAPANVQLTTTVVDGNLSNAKVCWDQNNNGVCDTGEPSTRSDANGQATLTIPTAQLATARLIAEVGTDAVDSDTGAVTHAYTLQAPAGRHAVLSPLTSLVQAKLAADPTLTLAEAEDAVKAELGLDTTVSPLVNFVEYRGQDPLYANAGLKARAWVLGQQKAANDAGCLPPVLLAAADAGSIDNSTPDTGTDTSTETPIDTTTGDQTVTVTITDTGIATYGGLDSDETIRSACATGMNAACDAALKTRLNWPGGCAIPPTTTSAAASPLAVQAVALKTQTITFATPSAMALGSTRTLVATANSGLAVSFASKTTGICTVSGKVVTAKALGTCTITASRAATSTYAAAASVTRSFAVRKAQTITFASPGNKTVGTSFTVAPTASSGLAVSVASNTPGVCSVSGKTVTLLAAGTCAIKANQAGNTTYAAAPTVTRSFTVAAASTTSAIHGKAVYLSLCASCHTSNPARNVDSVLRGTNYSVILNAISSDKGGMGFLNGAVSTQDAKDIAAYLVNPGI